MAKVDLKKELKHLYNPSAREVITVDVPEMNFLMVDGAGDPNTSREFQEAMEALFTLSYTMKFMVKKGERGIDYAVMPLEGLWWMDDMSKFSTENKDAWKWTMMIMQPEYVTGRLFNEAVGRVKQKKNPPALLKVRFTPFAEGKAVQIMHIGPFSEEGPTIEKLHRYIEENGCRRIGKHHEIYLSDIRRAAPERWRTVIRQPMK